jgi:hypothetical protein
MDEVFTGFEYAFSYLVHQWDCAEQTSRSSFSFPDPQQEAHESSLF